jgi:hypothetical protein
MKMSDKIIRSAQPFLEPGETVQAAFLAQTFSQFWMLLSYWFVYFTKAYRCVVVTDRRIIVLSTHRFNAAKAKDVLRILPRTTTIGSPTGTWWRTASLGEKLYIHKRHHQDIIAADAANGAPPTASAPAARPPAWHPDPFGRADTRWWNGTEWTSHVARDGQQFEDPPVAATDATSQGASSPA